MGEAKIVLLSLYQHSRRRHATPSYTLNHNADNDSATPQTGKLTMVLKKIPNKKRLIILIGVLLVSGFTATSLISYFAAAGTFRTEMTEDILPLTSDNIYSEIQKDLVRPAFIASMMASDTFLRDWVLSGEKDSKQITKYLAEIKEKYGLVSSFFVSESTRTYYYAGGKLKTVSPKDQRDRWYFRVRNMHQPYEINVDPDMADRDKLTIFINYRVIDYKGNYIGAAGCGLTVTTVQSLLDSYADRYQRTIYLVNPQGQVTLTGTHTPPPFATIPKTISLPEITNKEISPTTRTLSYSRNQETYLLNTRFIPQLGLYLFVEQSIQEQIQQMRKILLNNLGVSLIISVLVLFAISSTITLYQAKLESMATTDKLTQLLNRHAFEILFHQAVQEAERLQHPVTAILFDIDRFKRINDRYGHPAGDAVLVSVAATAAEAIRKSDGICRWGGEEFLLLLKDCSLEQGELLAEKIRQSIAETIIYYDGKSIQVEISLGLAQLRKGESQENLLHRIDQALYLAKEKGRNRLESAS